MGIISLTIPSQLPGTLVRRGTRELVGTANSFEQSLTMIVKDVNKQLEKMVPSLRDWIRNTLYKTIPVRTGKLLDTMLQTLHIEMTGNILHISALIPPEYPPIIINPKHSGAKGWGKKYDPINPIPNRVVIRSTKGVGGKPPVGNIYLLNDPFAVGEYTQILGTYVFPMVRDTVPQILANYDVIYYMPTQIEGKPFGVDDFVKEHFVSPDAGTVAWLEEDIATLTGGAKPTEGAATKVLKVWKWQLSDLELRTIWEQSMMRRREHLKFKQRWN